MSSDPYLGVWLELKYSGIACQQFCRKPQQTASLFYEQLVPSLKLVWKVTDRTQGELTVNTPENFSANKLSRTLTPCTVHRNAADIPKHVYNCKLKLFTTVSKLYKLIKLEILMKWKLLQAIRSLLPSIKYRIQASLTNQQSDRQLFAVQINAEQT